RARRREGERARDSVVEVEVGAAEEQSGVTGAVACQRTIIEGATGDLRGGEATHVVVLPRHPLTPLAQYSTPLEPAPQPVQDHHLVPERSLRLDGRHVRHAEVKPWDIRRHVRYNDHRPMRFKGRLGTGLDLYRRAHIA